MSIKTFEDARISALLKWGEIKKTLFKLDVLIDEDCGFCIYSNMLYNKDSDPHPTRLTSCEYCNVESLCDKLIELKDDKARLDFINFVYDLVDKLEDMKEENYKSRHQLKGGE